MKNPAAVVVFDSTREACKATAHPEDHTVIPVTDAADRMVRPASWADFHRVLEIEQLDSDHVRVLWNCDGPFYPPEPSTVFHRDEWVVCRP